MPYAAPFENVNRAGPRCRAHGITAMDPLVVFGSLDGLSVEAVPSLKLGTMVGNIVWGPVTVDGD